MKKSIIVMLFAAIVFAGCSSSKNLKLGLEKSSLQGKIRQMKVSVYNADNMFGEIKKKGLKYVTVMKFSKEGLIADEKKYRKNGKLSSRSAYKFDSSGNVLKFTNFNSEGKVRLTRTYKYNSEGNVVSEDSYSVKKRFLLGKYRKHDYISVFRYMNTDRGLMVREERNICPDGRCGKITNVYLYDDDGKLVEKKYEGNQYNDSPFFHVTVKYDDYGNVTEEKAVPDDKKDLVRLNSSSARKLNRKYKYTYDREGNWKTKLTVINGKPYTIIERVIEYY